MSRGVQSFDWYYRLKHLKVAQISYVATHTYTNMTVSLLQGTLQKFVDDLFTVILSTSQPVPLAVKYFFDLLDDQAAQHNITDPETIHIWKTNRLEI